MDKMGMLATIHRMDNMDTGKIFLLTFKDMMDTGKTLAGMSTHCRSG